jgi:hypothetical protein
MLRLVFKHRMRVIQKNAERIFGTQMEQLEEV